MARDRFNELLRRMSAIAKAVNGFDSEVIQQKAYEALLEAFNANDMTHSASPVAVQPTELPDQTAKLSTAEILALARGEAESGTQTAAAGDNGAEKSEQVPEKESELEVIKRESRFLKGQIATEMTDGTDHVGKASAQLLKFHGTYQQDNRDARAASTGGKSGKSFMYMVRTKIPGGRLTGEQLLAELDLCDEIANSTLRITSRQGLQLHGVLKDNLRQAIERINQVQLTTLGACGDVNRNVMCCPAPFTNDNYQAVQALADEIAAHLSPRSNAYHELWLQESGSEERQLVGGGAPDAVEPIYGTQYMPRKFKIGIGFPYDNCVDLYTHDLGLMAILREEQLIGYNVLVGGGQGVTPSAKKTFPALGKRMAFVTPEHALDLVTAIVKVQRDYGNRSDRKTARLKYLIHSWGLEKFQQQVEEYFGRKLSEPQVDEVHGFNDHLGWEAQGDGKWFYGLNVENGRLHDTDQMQLKSAVRQICRQFQPGVHLTTHQSMLFTNIPEEGKSELEGILRNHQVPLVEDLSTVRRWSMACVAWPTCGLSITEAERALPGVMDEMHAELAKLGLDGEAFTVRMTGCPNGCARPYNSDVGLVGKTKGKYTVLVGGRLLGNRLNFIYRDLVPEREIVSTLVPLFVYFKQQRDDGETFGDFCARKGKEDLLTWADDYAAAS